MDLNKLKKIALAASQGKWVHYCGYAGVDAIELESDRTIVVQWTGFDGANTSKSQARKNAKFIGAFGPETALEMIEELKSKPPHIKFKMPDRDQYCGEDYDQVYDQFAEALAEAGIILVDQDGRKFVL